MTNIILRCRSIKKSLNTHVVINSFLLLLFVCLFVCSITLI